MFFRIESLYALQIIVSRLIVVNLVCLYYIICEGVKSTPEIYFFRVNEPDYLGYSYEIQSASNFGVDFEVFYQNIRLVLAAPVEACGELTNDVAGVVVLVERGECAFYDKAAMAEAAGAAVVMVTDTMSADDSMIAMTTDNNRTLNIPVVYLPGIDGKRLRNHLMYKPSPITITIPLNLSLVPLDVVRKPPWDLW